MEPTQADRRISISTPLGDDKLLLQHFSGSEQLGRMFRYDLRLLSTDPDIKLADLLGQSVTVSMLMPDDETRYFNGYVTSFALEGQEGRFTVYSAIVRPWLWFLTRNADSRIFPEKNGQDKVPGIIMGIFRELGFSDFDDQLQLAYKAREHCVQYRETNFNFVMRLMEDEGIYFYFKHEDGKHTMVLCDDYGSHEAIAGYEEIPFHPTGAPRDIEFISSWGVRESVQTGMVALNDSDFMRPKADLLVKSKIAREHEHAEYEVFDYPGEYVDPADGEKEDKDGNDDLKSAFEQVAKTRIEEMQAQFESVEGNSNARGLYAGGLFSLAEHPRDDQNREYLIVSAEFDLRSDDFGSGDAGAGPEFGCSLTAIESKTPFRSQRLTPKPAIQGIQTATVSGPSGETIHTDKYGRVKVQFPWDRYGESNEESSCWVRVSQNRAGPGWGDMQLPHVGQEVIVSFLEGDPDRPIVIGRVFNEDNMPPKTLPAHKDLSVMRDHFGNQLIFDATPGKEHIALFSPSKKSGFVLGQSMIDVTWSSKTTVVYKNKHTHTRGNTASYTYGNHFSYKEGFSLALARSSSVSLGVGASISGFAGMKFGAFLGTSISVAVGTTVSMGFARTINCAKSDYVRVAKGDIKHDSENEVWLCGGKKDPSLVKAGPDDITLTYGEGPGRPSVRDSGAWGTAVAAVGGLIAAVGQAASASDKVEDALEAATGSWVQNTDTDEWAGQLETGDIQDGGSGWVLEGLGYAAVLGGTLAGLSSSDVADPTHTTEHAKIQINKTGVAITHAAKGPNATVGKKKGVKLFVEQGGKGQIWLNEKGELHIKCTGDIKINSDKKIYILQEMEVAKKAKFKAKIEHADFEAG